MKRNGLFCNCNGLWRPQCWRGCSTSNQQAAETTAAQAEATQAASQEASEEGAAQEESGEEPAADEGEDSAAARGGVHGKASSDYGPESENWD